MLTQFKGENRKNAVIEYYVLDVEEEESFFDFIKEMGYTVDDEDRIINGLYKMWRDKNDD